jgi:pimeloyl-ACP methyl ester carboxylesterase
VTPSPFMEPTPADLRAAVRDSHHTSEPRSPRVALVLLPGMDGTASLFSEFSTALGAEFEVIPVSYPSDVPLGYRELEQVARAALPEDKPFVLLGESFSGPIAIAIAASSPPGLLGLVLCCSFARNPLPLVATLRSFIKLLPVRVVPPSLLGFFLLGRFSSPSLAARFRQALSGVTPQALKARALAVLSVDVSQELREVSVPVLYLRASEDRVVPSSSVAHVVSVKPTAEVVELVAPHFLLQAIPAAAAEVVSMFVTRLSSGINKSLNTDPCSQRVALGERAGQLQR